MIHDGRITRTSRLGLVALFIVLNKIVLGMYARIVTGQAQIIIIINAAAKARPYDGELSAEVALDARVANKGRIFRLEPDRRLPGPRYFFKGVHGVTTGVITFSADRNVGTLGALV